MVPSALIIFAGTPKGYKMTKKSSSKPKKRNDTGDIFTDEDLPQKIGKNLRQMYDDVLNEPIPDDFLDLLTQADSTSK